MMEYLDLQICVSDVFPFIHALLTKNEPAPAYTQEQSGMQELEKVLTFMRDDRFYPSFTEKAAYMMCSIAGRDHDWRPQAMGLRGLHGTPGKGVCALFAYLSSMKACISRGDSHAMSSARSFAAPSKPAM